MVLTAAAIYALAIAAGFSGQGAVNMTAIVLAESGGDTQAVSPTADYGLVQIHLAAHPDVSQTCAFDPACAMRAAYAISGGGANFTPWSTWTNGRAAQFMVQAQAAAAHANAPTAIVPTFAPATQPGRLTLPPWWPWAAAAAAYLLL